VDVQDPQDERDRENEETRRQVYGNVEARGIVDALVPRWAEFTCLPFEPHLGAIYEAVLMSVDTALSNGTPREEIPALAEQWFRAEVKLLEP
jgi:hypothetical protein